MRAAVLVLPAAAALRSQRHNMLDDLIHDIRSALDEHELVDLDQRLARAPDLEKRFGALLQSCWRCNGGAVLAQRLTDYMDVRHG
jgi:hypothetical protein